MSIVEALRKEAKVKETTLPLVQGAYVIPIAPCTTYGDIPLAKNIRESGYVGRVNYYTGGTACSVSFERSGHAFQPHNMAFGINALRVVSPDEARPILARMQEEYTAATKDLRSKIKEITAVKRVALTDREVEPTYKKNYFDTNNNFVKLFANINEDKVGVGRGGLYAYAVCCALTKTESHIYNVIPEEWMSYFGYNIVDLRMWIKFLNSLGTSCRAHYLGSSTMSKEFTNIVDTMPQFSAGNLYITKESPAHLVMLESANNVNVNYMNFIMLRYLYNSQYWNIPTIALQIKKGLGTRVTHWEALLVALMYENYNGYYSLVQNQENQVALPVGNNVLANVMRRLTLHNETVAMNSSFTYTKISNHADIRKAINEKNYEYIYEQIVNWRKK